MCNKTRRRIEHEVKLQRDVTFPIKRNLIWKNQVHISNMYVQLLNNALLKKRQRKIFGTTLQESNCSFRKRFSDCLLCFVSDKSRRKTFITYVCLSSINYNTASHFIYCLNLHFASLCCMKVSSLLPEPLTKSVVLFLKYSAATLEGKIHRK
jgi:hypothetical protein